MIGPTWNLIDEMAHYVDFETKNKITVIHETDQTAQMVCCFLTGTYFLKAETTRLQTFSYVTIPSENFSLVGYKKDSVRKTEHWFS